MNGSQFIKRVLKSKNLRVKSKTNKMFKTDILKSSNIFLAFNLYFA